MAIEPSQQQGVLFPEEFDQPTGARHALREDADHRSSGEPCPPYPTPAYTYVSGLTQLTRLLPQLLAAPALACDTETSGLDYRTDALRLIQLATPEQVYLFDAYALPSQALAPVFETDRLWIFHNAKFDLKFLVGAGLPWPQRVFDTMLASQLLTAGLRTGHGLEDVVARRLDHSLPKTVRASDWTQAELSEAQRAYAARDVAVLWPLYTGLQDELKAAGLERAADIEFGCIKGLAWLEMQGMGFDAERWLARTLEDEARLADLKHRLDSTLAGQGRAVNWLSHQQVRQLFHDFGISLPNTRAASLKKVDHPLARLLLAYKETAKRVNTYGRAVIDSSCDPQTGRVYPVYFQNGAATGRMSCGGPNIQQIPKAAAFRACFRAAPDRALIRADYSQIELRIAAALADDETMLRAFRERVDLHALTASRILQLPLAEIDSQHRQLAKSVNFGLLYGMGVRGLKLDAEAKYGVAMTEAEAARYHRAFFHTYQGLQRWHQWAKRQIEHARRSQQTLETRTLTGRRFLNVRHFNVLLNIPVQGSGGDGLKLALGRLFDHRHEAPDAFPVACVHDEIVAEAPLSEADRAAEWLAHHMTAAMQEVVGDRVPIEVETTLGRDWAGAPLDA